jgi:hypothetical protein
VRRAPTLLSRLIIILRSISVEMSRGDRTRRRIATGGRRPSVGDRRMSDAIELYAKLRQQTAQLLGFDPNQMTAAQVTRLDRVTTLRLLADDLQTRAVRGESIDVAKFNEVMQELASGESTTMKIGTTFTKGRQKYTCVGFREDTNRFGRTSTLAICRSRCASCGDRFEFMTTVGAWRRREVNRRCARHKRPGVRVMAAPSRKIVELMRRVD